LSTNIIKTLKPSRDGAWKKERKRGRKNIEKRKKGKKAPIVSSNKR
jgi:hypothetical protein